MVRGRECAGYRINRNLGLWFMVIYCHISIYTARLVKGFVSWSSKNVKEYRTNIDLSFYWEMAILIRKNRIHIQCIGVKTEDHQNLTCVL